MKYFKLILLCGLILNFYSCASGPTQNNSDEDSGVISDSETSSEDSAVIVKDEPEVATKTVKPMDAGIENNLVQALKRQSDSDIIKSAQDVLMIDPNSARALNALGAINFKNGKMKAAEFFFNKAIKSHPNSVGLYNNLGLLKLSQNENREAVNLFKAGMTQKSDDKKILANLGSLYVMNKDFQNAEIALAPLYKSGTKDLKLISNYAVALVGTNKMTEATAVYEKALAENQSSREIMLNYSIHLIENVKNNKLGLDLINRLKFVGVPEEARNVIKDLENKAKAGLN